MRPYFEIGEEVLLCSREFPELNGQAIVLGVRSYDMVEVEGKLLYDRYGYKLTIDAPYEWWIQCALRKKHKKGDDFSRLMSDLNKELVK